MKIRPELQESVYDHKKGEVVHRSNGEVKLVKTYGDLINNPFEK